MNELPWAIEIIRGLGIAGGPVFAVLWWLERKERIDCQKTTRELLTQTLAVASQSANSAEVVAGKMTDLHSFTKEIYDKLSQLIRSIKKMV